MVRTSRKLPTEWTKYEPIGRVIAGTRLLTFKTPLHPELLAGCVSKAKRFTTLDLFRKMAESGQTLGLVINLNNTGRYYDRADVEGMLVGYKELPCSGRGFLEQRPVVKAFIKAVDEFLAANEDNDLLIGVNCGDGVNRSGYLVCRYLVDRLGWSSHQALEAFESARGYAFERGSLVQAIHKADRERRLKKRKADESAFTGEGSAGDEEEAPVVDKKRKRRKPESETAAAAAPMGLDPALAAQMMQQFFQIEKQFKQSAEAAAYGTPPAPLPLPLPLPLASQQPQPSSSLHSSPLGLPMPYGGGVRATPPVPMGQPAYQPNVSQPPPLLGQYQRSPNVSQPPPLLAQYQQQSPNVSQPPKAEKQQLPAFSIKSDQLPLNSSVLRAIKNKKPPPAAAPAQAPTTAAAAMSQQIFGDLKPEQISDDDDDDDEDGGEDAEGENGEERAIDYDSMGKVDVLELSAAQQRRMRRKKLEQQFQVMRRGKFWEINQMRKDNVGK